MQLSTAAVKQSGGKWQLQLVHYSVHEFPSSFALLYGSSGGAKVSEESGEGDFAELLQRDLILTCGSVLVCQEMRNVTDRRTENQCADAAEPDTHFFFFAHFLKNQSSIIVQ